MIYMIEDRMPHAHIFFPSWRPLAEKFDKDNIRDAYEDLTMACLGVADFVKILDGLCCGLYSPVELIVAGIFITDALNGSFIKEGVPYPAKYLRVNDVDMILLLNDHKVLSGKELVGCKFDGDNWKHYKLKSRKIRKTTNNMETSRANGRSPKDE